MILLLLLVIYLVLVLLKALAIIAIPKALYVAMCVVALALTAIPICQKQFGGDRKRPTTGPRRKLRVRAEDGVSQASE
jgi:hypothetical protein